MFAPEAWFTILSNLAFLYPAFIAFRFRETTLSIYSFNLAVMSLTYHIIDEGGLHTTERIDPRFYLEYGCLTQRIFCYSFFWLVDHVLSALYMLILVHFAMKCIFVCKDDPTATHYRGRILLWIAHAIDFTLVQGLILFEYEKWFSHTPGALYGYLAIASIVMVLSRLLRLTHVDRLKTMLRFLRHSKKTWLALSLIMCGAILEAIDSTTRYYQLLHGGWHVLAGTGIGLFMVELCVFRLEYIAQHHTDSRSSHELLINAEA